MEAKEKIKEYVNGDLTVVWKPAKCIHAAVCVETLPQVYDPNAKPWIKPENASIDELKAQIGKCPSGALSYRMAGATNLGVDAISDAIPVEVIKNGPVIVKGSVSIVLPDGSMMKKERSTAFCRCGASANKPFCDGTHKKVGFEG
ncbi:MAG: (4Fe-4S)-binding protein [Flavobacteriaceae bacterium]|nr:(4Fe-4S)-binding protein [Flavobacteriaceae bacterium]